jgi:hypothetical protein
MEEEKDRRRTWRDRMLENRREVNQAKESAIKPVSRSLSSKGDCTEFSLD